jgi:hypothetical protein
MWETFLEGHITKYQWSCSYCLESGRRKGERRVGEGRETGGFCGVVGFPTGWHLHFVSFTGRSSEAFCLVELLYKSWGRGYRNTDCRVQSWVWTWGGEDWGLRTEEVPGWRRCLLGYLPCLPIYEAFLSSHFPIEKLSCSQHTLVVFLSFFLLFASCAVKTYQRDSTSLNSNQLNLLTFWAEEKKERWRELKHSRCFSWVSSYWQALAPCRWRQQADLVSWPAPRKCCLSVLLLFLALHCHPSRFQPSTHHLLHLLPLLPTEHHGSDNHLPWFTTICR